MSTPVIHSHDPRLDWQPRHDERSRSYGIRTILPTVEEEPKRWSMGPVLDQGYEGACVGFGWTAELLGSPRPDPKADVTKGEAYAKSIYREAQRIDEWPGEEYEGTSVLAGAKVVQSKGHIGMYRWAFSIEEVRDAVIAEGPVVIGVPWYEAMYHTRPSGLVEVGGPLVGGHCLTLREYHPGKRLRGEDYHSRFKGFTWRNSWGPGYGVNGDGFIRYEDLRDLLNEWGEACVPVQRQLVRL